jgi:hypothetical protein
MHAALSGHVLRPQFGIVQYPPGCVVSQMRSLRMEQSVEMTHLSPMEGVHAALAAAATEASSTIHGPPDGEPDESWRAFRLMGAADATSPSPYEQARACPKAAPNDT